MTLDERILTYAEARARTGGDSGISFRDVARDIWLTRACVHR